MQQHEMTEEVDKHYKDIEISMIYIEGRCRWCKKCGKKNYKRNTICYYCEHKLR